MFLKRYDLLEKFLTDYQMVFLSLVILFSVLPSNFIVSGVKSSRLYPFLILNLTLFSILFTYISTDGLKYHLHVFLKYTQNNNQNNA